jgi:ABC-type amino acid transport substrate-binding protein
MKTTLHLQAVLAAILALGAPWADAAELTVCTCASGLPGDAGPKLLDGFELDLVAGFARRREVELRIEPLEGSCVRRLEGRLESGACDVGAVTLTYTPERAERMSLTSAYFPVRTVLIRRKDHQIVPAVEDLAGLTFATPRGLTSEALIKTIPGARIVYVDSPPAAFAAVAAGEVDATVYDSALVLDQLALYPDLRIGLALSEIGYYAFAVRLGSPLLAELDAYLAEIKRSGEYARLLEARYGSETAELLLEMLALAEGR